MLIHLTQKKIDQICKRAAAAKMAADKQESVTIPSKGADDLFDEILYGDPNEYSDLLEYISSLNKDELAELLALMWLGRGDDNRNPAGFLRLLEKAYREVRMDVTPLDIAAKAPLEKYLRNGLRFLKK